MTTASRPEESSLTLAPASAPVPATTPAPVPPPRQGSGQQGVPDRAGVTGAPGGRRLLGVAERYALLGLLVAIGLFFAVYPNSSATFPTSANLDVLLGNEAVTAMLALAVLMPLISGHFDFSVGTVSACSSVLCAGLQSRHALPLGWCVLAAVAFGIVVGTVNGVLVTRFKMNSFVSTLGMATLLGGGIQWYTNGQSISSGISEHLVSFGSATTLGIPQLIYVVIAAALTLWYVLTQTPFGRSLYATGSNARAAALVGIPVRRYTTGAFIGAGALAGVAGVLLAARTGGATADNGTSALFPALAAVFLGATAIQPGRFNVFGTVIGVLFLAVSVSGLTLAGASDWVQPVFNGVALLLAVGLSSLLASRRGATKVLG